MDFLQDIEWKNMFWFAGITTAIHWSVTTILALFYALIDKYSLFENAKISVDRKSTSNPKFKTCIKLLLRNYLPEPIILPAVYLILKQRMTFSTATVPSWLEVVIHIFVCMLIEDTMFYWLHRMLHIPFLYKNIHKIHHQYNQPIPLAYQYSHPLENFLTNSLPLLTGPFLLRSHVYTFWLWLVVRILESMDGHSGYDLWFMPFRYFPFRPGAQVHNYHHSHNIGNYGSFFCIWDKICGTDMSYKAYAAAKRLKKEL